MNIRGLVLIIATLSGLLVFYGWRQSQVRAETAVLQTMPAASQYTFQGIQPAPPEIGQFLLYAWQPPQSNITEYRYIPVKRNLWGD